MIPVVIVKQHNQSSPSQINFPTRKLCKVIKLCNWRHSCSHRAELVKLLLSLVLEYAAPQGFLIPHIFGGNSVVTQGMHFIFSANFSSKTPLSTSIATGRTNYSAIFWDFFSVPINVCLNTGVFGAAYQCHISVCHKNLSMI